MLLLTSLMLLESISGSPISVTADVSYNPSVANPSTILCTSDMNDDMGFCASSNDCAEGTGRSIGNTCDTGVCCKIESSCASVSTSPVTYFVNPSFPEVDVEDVSCNLNVRPGRGVCQIRVDFLDFEIPGPGGDGRCQAQNVFRIFAPSFPNGMLGNAEDVGLCGLNSGQHIYIPVDPSDIVQMHFILGGTGTVPNALSATLSSQRGFKWNLKITQIECGGDNEEMNDLTAPEGCLQYFKENFGHIRSFNMDGISLFSPSQDYYICLDKERSETRKACGVELSARQFGLPVDPIVELACIPGDLAINPNLPGGTGLETLLSQCCVANPNVNTAVQGSASLGVVGTDEITPRDVRYRWCGQSLGDSNQITTKPSPYFINVFAPRWPAGTPLTASDVGFDIQFKINTGSC